MANWMDGNNCAASEGGNENESALNFILLQCVHSTTLPRPLQVIQIINADHLER